MKDLVVLNLQKPLMHYLIAIPIQALSCQANNSIDIFIFIIQSIIKWH